MLHLHNIGIVQSVANILFLAGKRRTAAKHSSFLLHNITWSFGGETLTEAQIEERAKILELNRTEFISVFEQETHLKGKDFENRRFFEKPNIISPEEAKELGIIHEIKDLKFDPGTVMMNVIQGP